RQNPMRHPVICRRCEEHSDEAIHTCCCGTMDCFAFARNDAETSSLGSRQMTDLVGDLAGYGSCPWRAAAALDVDFHPVDSPAPGWADDVDGGAALDAAGALFVEEHERLLAARDFLDLLS